MQVLIKAGGNVNQVDTTYGATPLYTATEHGYVDLVQVLIAHGSCKKKKTKLKPGQGQFYIECVQAVRSIDIITSDAKLADMW